ncbi:DNA polymerase III [Streptococcus sp. HCA-5024]|uniref:DNA polymerase III n=1 Tax=Streptococcus sp. HCA-5024 TaxID=3134665 RepID=UPI0030BC6489
MEANDIVLFDFDAFISGSKDVDYQEAIKKMSLSLMKFLIENDLLVNINPFNQDGSVKNDLIIKKSNLTDEGFQLFVKPVNNWWNALDRGTPPEKVTILENGLKKIRAKKK